MSLNTDGSSSCGIASSICAGSAWQSAEVCLNIVGTPLRVTN
jgi:hypothetical protein